MRFLRPDALGGGELAARLLLTTGLSLGVQQLAAHVRSGCTVVNWIVCTPWVVMRDAGGHTGLSVGVAIGGNRQAECERQGQFTPLQCSHSRAK